MRKVVQVQNGVAFLIWLNDGMHWLKIGLSVGGLKAVSIGKSGRVEGTPWRVSERVRIEAGLEE